MNKGREHLRALAAHLQNIREEERARVAREIHDELGQTLTALKMDLSWLASRLPKDQDLLLQKTETMSKLVDTTIQSIWRITAELRPGILDDLGLTAAIEWQAQEFQSRTGIKCRFISGKRNPDLDQDRSIAVFRILQETLTNVARHAQATRVKISLIRMRGDLVLEVRDNGKGISEKDIFRPRSLGLLGMRERAHLFGGKLKIHGAPGNGTSVTLKIPLKDGSEAGKGRRIRKRR